MAATTPPSGDAIAAPDIYLLPGELRVATVPTRFLTVLGSCVSVCLIDAVHGIGGLNHYLLPGAAPEHEQEPLRWSEPAIARLVAELRAAGANPSCLRAKVFGGSTISLQPIPGSLRIGDRNVESALRELERLRIPVESRHTGGQHGRKIIFEANAGVVWVKELHNAQSLRNRLTGTDH